MTLLTVELVKQISAIRERYKEIRGLSYRNERTEEVREVIKIMLRAEKRRLIGLLLLAIGIDLLRIIFVSVESLIDLLRTIFMSVKWLIFRFFCRRPLSDDDIGDIICDARIVGDTIGDAMEDVASVTLDILRKLGFTFLDHWDTD